MRWLQRSAKAIPAVAFTVVGIMFWFIRAGDVGRLCSSLSQSEKHDHITMHFDETTRRFLVHFE